MPQVAAVRPRLSSRMCVISGMKVCGQGCIVVIVGRACLKHHSTGGEHRIAHATDVQLYTRFICCPSAKALSLQKCSISVGAAVGDAASGACKSSLLGF